MNYLGSITKIIGILASLAIFCAFFYENAFIWYLNSNHFPVPITVNDYANSFTYWLPSFVITLSVCFFIELLTRRIEKGMSEDEIVATSPNPPRTKKIRDLPNIILKCLVLLSFIIYVLFAKINIGSHSLTLATLVIFFWLFVVSPLIINTPLILLRWNHLIILSIYLIPCVIILLCFLGINGAYESINSEPQVTIQSEKIVRYYEKGKILLNNKGEIQWCESSEKRQCSTISNKKPKIIIKGIFCSTNNICLPISK